MSWVAKAVVCGLALLPLAGTARAGATLTTLYQFGNDQYANPYGLLQGPNGSLYGCTGGQIDGNHFFQLTPPSAGEQSWNYAVLLTFRFSCAYPAGGKLFDVAPTGGPFVDAARHGGVVPADSYGLGSVSLLNPPAPGHPKWTETDLHDFGQTLNDGIRPNGPVVLGKDGLFYGVTSVGGIKTSANAAGGGIVYRLAPPAPGKAAWRETNIFSFLFADGYSPGFLTTGSDNRLYGLSNGGPAGSTNFFAITPPPPAQFHGSNQILYRFAFTQNVGILSLLPDKKGQFWGTTNLGGRFGAGKVFHLSPPAGGQGQWSYAEVFNFPSAAGGEGNNRLAYIGSDGSLFGFGDDGVRSRICQCNLGGVFRLSPPTSDRTGWIFTVLHAFDLTDGGQPSSLIPLSDNGASVTLAGTTDIGGPGNGGTVFKLVVTP